MSWSKFARLSKWMVLTLLVSACAKSSAEVLDKSQPDQPTPARPASGAKPKVTPASTPSTQAQPAEALTGSYVGEFVPDLDNEYDEDLNMTKINLSIDAIEGKQVTGHAIVAGAVRDFKGNITQTAPGKFNIKAQSAHPQTADHLDITLAHDQINGRWKAGAKGEESKLKDLRKKSFRYQPEQVLPRRVLHPLSNTAQVPDSYNKKTDKWEAITADAGKFNASIQLLRSEDVENMYRRDLEVLRNSIYARHGYIFKDKQMRFFFDRVDWYMPVSADVSGQLTEVEKQNIALIQRYEKYASAYYRHFGR